MRGFVPSKGDDSRHPEKASLDNEEVEAAPLTNEQLLEELDVNHDGIISQEEWKVGKKTVDLQFQDSLEINIDKLTSRLMFEDEKRSCGSAACAFFMFTGLYMLVIDLQFNTSASYAVTKGMTDFITGTEGYDEITDGEAVMNWTRDSIVPAVFGDEKYNGQKFALWERNYMMGHNKLIGGIFLEQKRGKRRDERFCTGRFSLFYPACYSEDPDVAPFGPEYRAELDEEFQESLVVQSSLGKSTQEEVCAELALGGDGTFCVKCLETLTSTIGGVTKTLKRFQHTGDCGSCYEQCVLLVGPNADDKLTQDEVCGLCTYQDTSALGFSTVGDMDWLTPPVTVNYMAGLLDSGGRPNPSQIYGWDAKAPGAVDIHIVASRSTAPGYDALMRDVAVSMGLDGSRLRPHLAMHMVQTASKAGRVLAGNWEDGSEGIPGKSAFWSDTPREHTVRLHVMKGTNPTPVEAIDRLVDLWRIASTTPDGFLLAGTAISKVVSDHSVCTQDRTSCLATTCETCLDDTEERGVDLSKIEKECSSFFSGGPLETEDGERYDCAVRLGGGDTASSADGDGQRFGRVEVKNGNTWGTICSTGWDDTDADVLCKSIGYEGGTAKTVATNCEESERDDWCLTPESTVGTIAVASVDAAANAITIAPTCTADDPTTAQVENADDNDLIEACDAVDVNAATARSDCLGTEQCVETNAGSASSNLADANACAQVVLDLGANFGERCSAIGTAKQCSGTPSPAGGVCHGWHSGSSCFGLDESMCTGGCTWLAQPTCAQNFAASATCTGGPLCEAQNGIAMTRTSCEAAASDCLYLRHSSTRERGDWLMGTINFDGTPMPDCPPGCTYHEDDTNFQWGDNPFKRVDEGQSSGLSGYVGQGPSACTYIPPSGCFFHSAEGSCAEAAAVPVAADTATCAAVVDPTSAVAASCTVRSNAQYQHITATDASQCAGITGANLATNAACLAINAQQCASNPGDSVYCSQQDSAGFVDRFEPACSYTPARTVKEVCEAEAPCTWTDGIAASIAPGQTLSLGSADGKECAATPAGADLIVESVLGSVVIMQTDITATDALASENCVLTASQCESTSQGRVDYTEITMAAGSTCNLKIIARSGQFGSESRWQLDAHLDGPTGGFSADMERTENVYDFLTPGVHKLKLTDSGRDGWQPLWEKNLVPLYPECEEFWKYQVGDCRLCVAHKNPPTCTGSPGGLDCAAAFSASSGTSKAACPDGCTYRSPYTECERECATCASPCTGHGNRATCEAVTWNEAGRQQENRCSAWTWATWPESASTNAAAQTACNEVDISGPDPESDTGEVAWRCQNVNLWDLGIFDQVYCKYEPAVNMCEWDDENGCVDFDPCPYAEDGVCDIGMAGDYRCPAGDWQDCDNPLLCDIDKGETCNRHLDSAGDDATAGSIEVIDRVCTDENGYGCGDASDASCTCVDGASKFLQWVHEGLDEDPDPSVWSFEGEVVCGSCPGNKFFPGGLGCDMQAALDENRWTCYGQVGCSAAFSEEDTTTEQARVETSCPAECEYQQLNGEWSNQCDFNVWSEFTGGYPTASQVEATCNAYNAGRCVYVPPSSNSGAMSTGHCDTCRTKRPDDYGSPGSPSARNSADCAALDQCAWTAGHTDAMTCVVDTSDSTGDGSDDQCNSGGGTDEASCCMNNRVTVSCKGIADSPGEICDMDPATTHTNTGYAVDDPGCPVGCATVHRCEDGDGDTCLYTSAGSCNPAELETQGTAAVSWRGSGGTCPCMPAWTETTCTAPYGEGQRGSPVWLADVHCSGTEDSLCSCKQSHGNGGPVEWGAGLWLCDNQHSLDAGVECFGVQQTQPERMQDCDGVCVPKSVQGDGWCDEGEFNAQMNCQQLGCDGGDCTTGCEPAPTQCASGKWGCDNGVCIEGSQRCDNIPNCGAGDKSDETHCGDVFCCSDGTACIPNGWRNDGWPDCLDGSDEAGLQKYDKSHWNFNNLYCRGVLPMCDLYMQDRDLSCSETILPGDGCPSAKWGDGQCDDRCGTARCNYDGGDCPVGLDMLTCPFKKEAVRNGEPALYGPDGTTCSSVATEDSCNAAAQCSWRTTNSSGVVTGACQDGPMDFWYNGQCDLEFNVSSCNYDNEECLKCSWNDEGRDCDPDWLADGFCDWDCHTANCNYDGGDCPAAVISDDDVEMPADEACPAFPEFLGDGICDRFFNTEACGCDLGDCKVGAQDDPHFDSVSGLGRYHPADARVTVGERVFLCGTGLNVQTLKQNKVCDGVYDCLLGEDEIGCAKTPVCDATYIRLRTASFANEIQFSVDSGQTYGDTERICYIEDACTPVQADNLHHVSICNSRAEQLMDLPYGDPSRDKSICEAGDICLHNTNECTGDGFPAGCCPTVDEQHHCSDGGTYCQTFMGQIEYKLSLHLPQGPHTLHTKDLGADGWGSGVTFSILQMNPNTRREVEVRTLTVQEIASIGRTGTDFTFDLTCVPSTETAQAACLAAGNTWDTSVAETCVAAQPCSGTADDVVAYPSCAAAFQRAARGHDDHSSACPPGCVYAGPDIPVSSTQGNVRSIDVGAANSVTLSNPGIAIVVGQKLRLVDAPGQSCSAAPKGADLVVESISACGSVIKFSTDITAGDANARTKCKIATECGAADLSGELASSRLACLNVGGQNSGKCTYQAANSLCRATNADNAVVEKSCSDGTTVLPAHKVCDGINDCPSNPACVPIHGASVESVIFEGTVTPATARIHTIVIAEVDSSILPGQTVRLANAQGQTCGAAPLNSDLTVDAVCGAEIKIKTTTPLTSGETRNSKCMLVRSPAPECTEDEMCTFKCDDPPCNIDMVAFPAFVNGCTQEMRGDGTCDPVCFTASCNFDALPGGSGDCEQCAVGCYEWLRGDGTCNPECATPECNYDAPAVDECRDAKHSVSEAACTTTTNGDNDHDADHDHSSHTACMWDTSNNVCLAKPDCNPDIDTVPSPDTCLAAATADQCTACSSAVAATRDEDGCVLGNQCARGIDCGSALASGGGLYDEAQCNADPYCSWSTDAACQARGDLCWDESTNSCDSTGYSMCNEFSFDPTGSAAEQCTALELSDYQEWGMWLSSNGLYMGSGSVSTCHETTESTCAAISGKCTFTPSMCAGTFPPGCHGTDDGNGVPCTLNADETACAVQGGNCLYTAGGNCEDTNCGTIDPYQYATLYGKVHQCKAVTPNGCQQTDSHYNPTGQPSSCQLECGNWNPAWDQCTRSVATCTSPCSTVTGRVESVTGGTPETCTGIPSGSEANCQEGYVPGDRFTPSTTCPTGCSRQVATPFDIVLDPTAASGPGDDDHYLGWAFTTENPHRRGVVIDYDASGRTATVVLAGSGTVLPVVTSYTITPHVDSSGRWSRNSPSLASYASSGINPADVVPGFPYSDGSGSKALGTHRGSGVAGSAAYDLGWLGAVGYNSITVDTSGASACGMATVQPDACELSRTDSDCAANNACDWDASALGGSGRCAPKTNACTGVSDLDWARSFAIETTISATILQGTVAVNVATGFRDAVVAANGANALAKLQSSLEEAIGTVLVLPSYDVEIVSIVDTTTQGRRQLQSTGQLTFGYELACASCSTCESVTTNEADCAAAAGGSGTCTWADGVCSASVVHSAQEESFSKAVLSAFLHSASVCCPTRSVSGGVGPAACATAGTNTLPSVCKSGAYGAGAIMETLESLTAALPAPTEITIDASDIQSLECAADRAWGSTTPQLSAANQNADVTDATNVVIDFYDGNEQSPTGCLFEMVMDGVCQCDCIQVFEDELCGLNDAASGDCTANQVGQCNGLAAGTSLPCDFYDNPPACNAPATGCQWNAQDFGCSYLNDPDLCTEDTGCVWSWDLWQCEDPPRCQPRPCEENQHVVDSGCVNCPDGSFNWAGDSPAAGNTPCRTSLSDLPCTTHSGQPGSVHFKGDAGSIYFTHDAPARYARDFASGDRQSEYRNDLLCSWTIECQTPGHTPTLSFSTFNTEAGWDYVWVHDGTSQDDTALISEESGDYGNYWPYGDVEATGSTMFVFFDSDSSVTASGFNAEYTCEGDRRRLEPAYDNASVAPPRTLAGLSNNGSQFVPQVLWHELRSHSLHTTRANAYEPRELPSSWVRRPDKHARAALRDANTTSDLLFESSRRQLGRAAALAPRVIPDDFISAAPTPPPAPPVVGLNTKPPPPPVTINATSAALAPATSLGLGGFTPSCPGQPGQDLDCEDEEVRFMYFIEITQDQEVEKIRKKIDDTLVDGLWIDPQTRQVVLRFAAYNGNLGLFSVVEASFWFDLGGEVSKDFSVTVLDLELVRSSYTKEDGTEREYGTNADTLRIVLEFFVVTGVFYLAAGELKDLRDAKQVLGKYRYYFSSWWNFVDLLHITLYVIAIFYWIVMFTEAQKILPPQYFDWSDPQKLTELLDTIDMILNQANLYNNYRALNIANLFVVLVLVFKFTRFQGRLAVVNDTLSLASEPLFHFGVIFGATVGLYSIMGKIVFGHQVLEFSSLGKSFNQNFNGIMGAWDVFDMTGDGGLWGGVFYYTYTFLVFFVLINFFLAIVMEAYDEANSASAEATSAFSDMAEFLAEWRGRILHRNQVEPVMETNEDGTHEFEMDTILDERVIAVLQQIRFSAGMTVSDAGMLRKAIVAKFVEEPDEGKSSQEMERIGWGVARALVIWYFEEVDPEMAPGGGDDGGESMAEKVDEIHSKMEELKQQLDTLLSKAE